MYRQIQHKARELTIKMPLLWLLLVAVVLYLPSLSAGITRLDDYVFVYKFRHYYEHYSHLVTSFRRGVFGVNDHFYRPLFLNSFLLNYKLTHGSLFSFHLVNVGLHAVATMLLYILFTLLYTGRRKSFLLSLLFCVHPVSVQAVTWLPGRNETLLAVFVFAYFISSIKYSNTGKSGYLFLSACFLLLAMFTKETGLLAAPACFVLHCCYLHRQPDNKKLLPLFVSAGVVYTAWCAARFTAAVHAFPLSPVLLAKTFIKRWILVVQYSGKIFLPGKLSVFPTIADTSIWPGLAAFALLGTFIYLSPRPNRLKVVGGLGIFLLFLLPAMIVPDYMSIQAFEHRLYLPLAGMLLVFPQFMIFSNKVPARLLASGILPVIVLFAGINILHQRNFVNPLRFWTQAVETSPSSAYAHMLLALQQPDKATALQTMQQAQLLDPKTHHIHFNKGLLYGKFNEMDSAWYYFLAEQRLSGYYECNFQLARIAKKTGRLQLARDYYAQYLSRNPNRGTNDLSSFQQQYPIADTSLSIYFSKVLK